MILHCVPWITVSKYREVYSLFHNSYIHVETLVNKKMQTIFRKNDNYAIPLMDLWFALLYRVA